MNSTVVLPVSWMALMTMLPWWQQNIQVHETVLAVQLSNRNQCAAISPPYFNIASVNWIPVSCQSCISPVVSLSKNCLFVLYADDHIVLESVDGYYASYTTLPCNKKSATLQVTIRSTNILEWALQALWFSPWKSIFLKLCFLKVSAETSKRVRILDFSEVDSGLQETSPSSILQFCRLQTFGAVAPFPSPFAYYLPDETLCRTQNPAV